MTKPTGHISFAQVGARWRRFLFNRRAIANAAQLTPSELQRMARDVGLDERDLHTPREPLNNSSNVADWLH